MVVLAIGGVAWVFLYPILSGEKAAERRMASVTRAEPVAARPTRAAQKSRREQVEGSLKQLEARQKTAKRVPLSVRIAQAGLEWSTRRFMMTAAALAAAFFLVPLIFGVGILQSLGLGFGSGAGVPCLLLSFMNNRRGAKFLHALPNSLDVIVRVIKAVLPLLDSV